MTRWPLLLLAVLACAVGIAACGGDDDTDVAGVLAETFGEDKNIDSGRLDLALRIDAKGLANLRGPVGVQLSGPFDTEGDNALPRFDFQLGVEQNGSTFTAGGISTGDKAYVRLRDQVYELSDALYQQFKRGYAEQAKKGDDKKGNATFQALGIDPRRWLKDPRIVGTEDVGGTSAIHIASNIEVRRFLADLSKITESPAVAQATGAQPRAFNADQQKLIAEAMKEAKVDVWTGEDDKILRRLNVLARFDVPEARRKEARGLRNGTLKLDISLGAINQDQRIVAPRNAKPLDELLTALGAGTLPGLDGNASRQQQQPQQQQPRTTPAQPPTPGASSQYLECVQQAGGDVKKLQRCADLVGR